MPMSVSRRPWPRTIRITTPGDAPSAMRRPISLVRNVTRCAITLYRQGSRARAPEPRSRVNRSIEVDGPAAFPVWNRLHGKMRASRHPTQENVQPNLKGPAGEVARVVRSSEPLQVDARRDMVGQAECQIVVCSSARVGIVGRLQ